MGSVREQRCPICGLRVKLMEAWNGRVMTQHGGWDGEPCRGSGMTPGAAMDDLRATPADTAI